MTERGAERPTASLADRYRIERELGAGGMATVYPATIQDHATFERPHQYATGVVHVFVNGTPVLRDGEHTGALPGRVVRGPGWTGWRANQA